MLDKDHDDYVMMMIWCPEKEYLAKGKFSKNSTCVPYQDEEKRKENVLHAIWFVILSPHTDYYNMVLNNA